MTISSLAHWWSFNETRYIRSLAHNCISMAFYFTSPTICAVKAIPFATFVCFDYGCMSAFGIFYTALMSNIMYVLRFLWLSGFWFITTHTLRFLWLCSLCPRNKFKCVHSKNLVQKFQIYHILISIKNFKYIMYSLLNGILKFL